MNTRRLENNKSFNSTAASCFHINNGEQLVRSVRAKFPWASSSCYVFYSRELSVTRGPYYEKLLRCIARNQPIKFKDSGFRTNEMFEKENKIKWCPEQ